MAFDDELTVLSGAPLFNLMNSEALRLVLMAAERRALGGGEVLFSKGERSNGGFIVLTGSIALEPRTGISLVVSRGALIGQIALFTRMSRPATARAQENCTVLRISPILMRRVLEAFPATADAVRGVLASELSTVTNGLSKVRDRLLAGDCQSRG